MYIQVCMPVLVSDCDKQYLYHACNQTALGCEWHAYSRGVGAS